MVHLFFGVVIDMLCFEVSEVVGSFSQGRRRWYLMSKRMSPKCVVAVLGLGNFRTNRLLHGRKDRRFRLWGGAHRLQLSVLHSESSKHHDDQDKLILITLLQCHIDLLACWDESPVSQKATICGPFPIGSLHEGCRNAAAEVPWQCFTKSY